jgi:hypothetical protein
MSDLEHWSSDGATEEEAALLAAARGGGPSSASRARMAAALGIGGAMASVAPAAIKAPVTLAKWLAAKWLVVGVVGAVAVAGGVAFVKSVRAHDPVAVSMPIAPTASIAFGTPNAVAPVLPPESAPPEPAPPEPAPTVAPQVAAPARPRPVAAPRPSSSVDAELSVLETAKEALDQHRPDAALATVAEYQRRHPRGQLALEASVIRIEALAQARRLPEARAAAQSFLSASPTAVQAARVRSLLREIDASK